jgi:predicted DNA-binding transcriptional regulator AlpA
VLTRQFAEKCGFSLRTIYRQHETKDFSLGNRLRGPS